MSSFIILSLFIILLSLTLSCQSSPSVIQPGAQSNQMIKNSLGQFKRVMSSDVSNCLESSDEEELRKLLNGRGRRVARANQLVVSESEGQESVNRRSPLIQMCLDHYKQALPKRRHTFVQLARLFSSGILAGKKANLFDKEAFRFVASGCPASSKEHARYKERLRGTHDAIAAVIARQDPYGSRYPSPANDTNWVESKLKAACQVFLVYFIGVFKNEFILRNADGLMEEIMREIEHNDGVKLFMNDLQTYLHCSLLTSVPSAAKLISE